MTSLQALAERLEKATGPDREIDAQIALTFDDAGNSPGFWQWKYAQPKGYDATPEEFALKRAPRYSESLDAAIALCTRLYPDGGWRVEYHRRRDHSPHDFWASAGTLGEQKSAYGHHPALALVLAIVRARIAEETL